MTVIEFYKKHQPSQLTHKSVIELMEEWAEYKFVGQLLYSYDKELDQDKVGVETMEDFDKYIASQI